MHVSEKIYVACIVAFIATFILVFNGVIAPILILPAFFLLCFGLFCAAF